jgi:predicted outer membrane repeat protein
MVLLLTLAQLASATTWYVNGVSGSDINNCLSAITPCKTIGNAISLALSGDSIMAAAATYTENLNIAMSINLIGSGAATTIIDGGGVGTVVTILKGAKVSLSGFSIVHGVAQIGAGISNSGALKVQASIVSGNQGHASCSKESCNAGVQGVGIYNHGSLTLSYSAVTGNSGSAGCPYKYNFCNVAGAGIYNHGGLNVSYSTIKGNGAGTSCVFTYAACYPGGGGIYNSGTLSINKTTISNNSANAGRCVSCYGRGGGIYNGGKLTITNSTISGNSASGYMIPSGGGIYASDSVTISNSTISGNGASGSWNGANLGGNIYGGLTMQNSIVANSTSGANCNLTITSNGYNLSTDNTCNLSGPGDMNNVDPMLGPLQNNGGPTQTMALSSGSPAIDAGNPNGCANSNGILLKTDQRGMRRPDKEDTGDCDIGAYESQTD